MRKKVVWFVVFLFMTQMLGGCFTGTKHYESPYTLSYEITADNAGFFADGENAETILLAGPFYTGNAPMPLKGFDVYVNAKNKKVDAIIKAANELFIEAQKTQPKVDEIRNILGDYLSTASKKEGKLTSVASDVVKKMSLILSNQKLAEASVTSLDPAGAKDAAGAAYLNYKRVVSSTKYAALVLEDLNLIVAYASITESLLSESKDKDIIEANNKLDKDMDKLSGLKKDVESIKKKLLNIDFGMRQLQTSDYYAGLAGINFVMSSLPDLKSKVAALKEGEDYSKDDIEFLKSQLSFYEKFSGELEKNLNTVDRSRFVDVDTKSMDFNIVKYAYAASDESFDKSVNALDKAIDKNSESSSTLEMGWNALKTVAGKTRQAAGLTLDVASSVTGNLMRYGCGLYYGDTLKDRLEDMDANCKEVVNNFNNNTSGSKVLKDAGSYLDYYEQSAGDAMSGAAEMTIGKGNTSWALGGVGRIGAGMLTGLGKGLYKIADPKSSSGEVAAGLFEVVLSSMGGSKIFVKASQLPFFAKSLGKESIRVGKMSINFFKQSKLILKNKTLFENNLKLIGNKMTQGDILQVINNTKTISMNSSILGTLSESNKVILTELTAAFKSGGKEALKSSAKNVKSEITKLIYTNYTNNMSGVLNNLKDVLGSNAKDILDNFAGEALDDVLEKEIEKAVNEYMGEAVVKAGLPEGTFILSNGSLLQEGTVISGEGLYSREHKLISLLQINVNGGSFSSSADIKDGSISISGNYDSKTGTLTGKIVVKYEFVTEDKLLKGNFYKSVVEDNVNFTGKVLGDTAKLASTTKTQGFTSYYKKQNQADWGTPSPGGNADHWKWDITFKVSN